MTQIITAPQPKLAEQKNKPVADTKTSAPVLLHWKNYEKIAFRFFFIYFLLQIVPLDWKFYRDLFAINWGNLYYGDIFNIAHYTPRIIPGADTFLNWLIIAAVAGAGTVAWTLADKKRNEYNVEYYWLRVALRYRLAIAAIAYGFIKFFPLLAPFPTTSQLNTLYGEYTTWKMFLVSLGAAPKYEIFLGTVEILAGLLLLFRKTATIGAFVYLTFISNVFLSDIAYEGGEYVYSLFLVSIAAFLLFYDGRRLSTLLFFEKPTNPNRFKFSFREKWQRNARLIAKSAFIFFFVFLYGFKTYDGYKNNPHHIPTTKGLDNSAGFYNVSEFSINNSTLPYSTTDPVRWQNVVFETWNTISIRSNREVTPDINNVEKITRDDKDKNYELEGTIGRHFYSYTVDDVNQTLTLHNKNRNYKNETLVLHYERPDAKTIVLSGVNENKEPIRVVLNRLNKKYLIIEGRRKPQTL